MIAVFGDFIIDEYIYGTVDRISPESPIPVFKETKREMRDGGVGNVYNNLKALGSNPKLHTHKLVAPIKTRYVCDNHIMFRSDNETYLPNTKSPSYDLTGVDYCLLSDYNKGYLHHSKKMIEYCHSKGCKVVVDPKKALHYYKGADIVKLNEKELKLYGQEEIRYNFEYQDIRYRYDIGALVITMADKGVYIDSPEYCGIIHTNHHNVADVTGAGDVFVAAMTHYLDKGKTLFEACTKAVELASISVTKFGTYVLTQEDIAQTRTVFTNGCFDVLHRGHIEYLKASKKLGARLIVGLNSDRSIRKLKGKTRPVNSEQDRQIVLQELDCVDEVILFNDDTPYDLIKQINPDIITKGGDYKPEEVVGNDLAEVVIIPYIEGYSTTKILEKI